MIKCYLEEGNNHLVEGNHPVEDNYLEVERLFSRLDRREKEKKKKN
jgi:hypothetical protein